jgi:hypothetical protein
MESMDSVPVFTDIGPGEARSEQPLSESVSRSRSSGVSRRFFMAAVSSVRGGGRCGARDAKQQQYLVCREVVVGERGACAGPVEGGEEFGCDAL